MNVDKAILPGHQNLNGKEIASDLDRGSRLNSSFDQAPANVHENFVNANQFFLTKLGWLEITSLLLMVKKRSTLLISLTPNTIFKQNEDEIIDELIGLIQRYALTQEQTDLFSEKVWQSHWRNLAVVIGLDPQEIYLHQQLLRYKHNLNQRSPELDQLRLQLNQNKEKIVNIRQKILDNYQKLQKLKSVLEIQIVHFYLNRKYYSTPVKALEPKI